jgi:pantoate--beta-alanine ligase
MRILLGALTRDAKYAVSACILIVFSTENTNNSLTSARNSAMPTQYKNVETMRTAVQGWRQSGKRVALVPTMGALHEGHMSLVNAAQMHADAVVVSIFVNPMQFGEGEDFDAYPRVLAADMQLCDAHGVRGVYTPSAAVMYPDGFATNIHVAGVSEGLCGASRHGHFDGVATVVAKLLLQVEPDVALFGEKDFQQLQVIRRMVLDLNLPVKIVGVPTNREADGLARSSRNAYLTEEERAIAPALYRGLQDAAVRVRGGEEVLAVLDDVQEQWLAAGFREIDYVACCDAKTLAPLKQWQGESARILAAAYLGKARLIDNLTL